MRSPATIRTMHDVDMVLREALRDFDVRPLDLAMLLASGSLLANGGSEHVVRHLLRLQHQADQPRFATPVASRTAPLWRLDEGGRPHWIRYPGDGVAGACGKRTVGGDWQGAEPLGACLVCYTMFCDEDCPGDRG